MAIRIFLTAASLVCLICVSAGAWTRSSRPVSELPATRSFAQPVRVTDAPVGVAGEGRQLLDRLLVTLRSVHWLQMTVAQKSHAPIGGFESQSTLILGPGECARVESTIRVDAAVTKQLIVSDGRVLAEILRRSGEPDKIASFTLPGQEQASARSRFMGKHGCVSPLPLLQQLRDAVPAWSLHRVKYQDRTVLRLDGSLDPDDPTTAGRTLEGVRSCRLYLDPDSLWPLRLEWWTGGAGASARLNVEIEYRDAVLNQPLTHDQCARLFSYQP